MVEFLSRGRSLTILQNPFLKICSPGRTEVLNTAEFDEILDEILEQVTDTLVCFQMSTYTIYTVLLANLAIKY